jgi:hypothetical protein
MVCESTAKGYGFRRVLQEERALKIFCAMQAARQYEVAFKERAPAFESFDDLFGLQNALLHV